MTRLAAAFAALAVASSARAASFAPGEETLLEVRYLSVLAGEARIAVGQPEGVIWPVFFQARTRGLAGLVDVREHLVSYWDVVSRLPRGSELRAFESGELHVDRSRFDRLRGRATLVRERKGRRSERTFPVPEGAHDLTSAFLWLRLQELAPGGPPRAADRVGQPSVHAARGGPRARGGRDARGDVPLRAGRRPHARRRRDVHARRRRAMADRRPRARAHPRLGAVRGREDRRRADALLSGDPAGQNPATPSRTARPSKRTASTCSSQPRLWPVMSATVVA